MAGFLGALPSSAWNMGAAAGWPMSNPITPNNYLNDAMGYGTPSASDIAAGKAFGSGNGYNQSPGMFGIEGLGANIETLKLGLGGLQSVAGIWNAMESNKLAKKQFNLNSGILNTNLANSIKAYNSTLDDRLRSRQVVEGTSDAYRESERAKWAARDERKG